MKTSARSVRAFILLVLLMSVCAPVFAGEDDPACFVLRDEQGEMLTMTGRELDPGDHYIAADNRLYEVAAIEGSDVRMIYLETVILPDLADESPGSSAWAGGASGVVGIYHTHNAESYVPTSGTEAKDDGDGDILEVGRSLAAALEQTGLSVIHSENSHLPQDGQAYLRSRRTAMEILTKNPATLIDVHRDATPPEIYETEIEGAPATKVRLVVGRQNQNRAANLEYAKRIKAAADQRFPGMIEGIFDARGNYNQDLGPKMILLEFGAHTNRLEQAQRAAEFFAKILPAAAGLGVQEGGSAQGQIGKAAGRSLIWLILIVVLGATAFVLINKGKIGSLGGFFRREAGLEDGDNSDSE